MNDDVYYRLYLYDDSKITIVTMQWFDEDDYDKDRFYKENGVPLMFSSEYQAKEFLNKHFKEEYIDPYYLDTQDLFSRMKK